MNKLHIHERICTSCSAVDLLSSADLFVCLFFCFFIYFFWVFGRHTASLPSTAGTHTGGVCLFLSFFLSWVSKTQPNHWTIVFLFVCLFVWIKPKKLYSSWWEGSKPCGSDHTRAEVQNTCIPKTGVQTTYVSIYGQHSTSWRTGSHPWIQHVPHLSHPQPPNSVPPCLVWRIGFGRGEG